MKALLLGLIATRRKVRRADYAVSLLRLEASRAARSKDRDLARYLRSLADVIEGTP